MVKNLLIIFVTLVISCVNLNAENKKLVYLVFDSRIPFWDIMSRGIQDAAIKKGYEIEILSANNIKKTEMINIAKIMKEKVDGIIISPINSSTGSTILKLVKKSIFQL